MNRKGLITLIAVAVIGVGGVVHAQLVSTDTLGGMYSWLENNLNYIYGNVVNNSQWHQTGSYGASDWEHPTVVNTYTDSTGDVLTLYFCENNSYADTTQSVCTSAPNACGARGTGFITDHHFHNANGIITDETHTPCTAQTPPDSICAPACTPATICRADGNLYDSCTGALVKSCASGCSAGSGQCNPDTQCTSSNICAADGNVHDSCSGALLQVCQYGCSAGLCVTASTSNSTNNTNGQCTSQNVCYADGDVHDSCTGSLLQTCQYGCTNGVCNATCSPHNACQSDGNLHNSCTGALIAMCKWGCAGNYCNSAPQGLISAFTVSPALVKSGNTSTATWTVKHVTDCNVTATNGDHWQSSGDGTYREGTSHINGQTTYTLACTGLDGGAVTAKAVVNILPAFDEK